MKDKYYTPEIEEFHIGFEYEANVYNIKKGYFWFKTKMDLTFDFYAGNTRVKYLDKEDIESLGYKPQYPDMQNTGFINKNIYEEGAIIISLRGDNQVSITKCYHPNTSTLIFTIKNKSELKRLLKMLEI